MPAIETLIDRGGPALVDGSWQEANGPLPAGSRLVPKQPFVLGGPFERDNLYVGDAVEAMCFRGDMARQIAELPDGASLTIRCSE